MTDRKSKAASFLTQTQTPAKMSTEKPVKRRPPSDFDGLCERFAEVLHFPQSYSDTLAIMLAVSLSNTLPGDPLWLHVVGPPSSGKSTLCECLGADTENTVLISKMTGLLSGWKEDDKKKKRKGDPEDHEVDTEDEDFSPILMLLGKTLIIKDFTTIMTMPPQGLQNLFGELRDAYDGRISAVWRNDLGHRDYANVRFTIITGVTDEINRFNHTTLGERFLKVELLDSKSMPRVEATEAAIQNTLNSLTNGDVADVGDESESHHSAISELRKLTAAHVLRMRAATHLDAIRAVSLKDDQRKQIAALAQICGLLRSTVHRTRMDGDPEFRPRAEMGGRLGGQLVKLGVMLCLVRGIKQPDETVMRLIQKVALDSCVGYYQEVAMTLAAAPESGLTKESIAQKINLAGSTVYRRIADLMELGGVEKAPSMPNGSAFGGRPSTQYRLTSYLRDLCTTAGLVQSKPKPPAKPARPKRPSR